MKALKFLFLLFALVFGATIFTLQLAQPGAETIRIEVTAGESVADIAATLKRHGLIRSATAFRLYLKTRGLDTQLQAGNFALSRDASFSEIAEALSSGASEEMRITIPEGYTIAQMDSLLAEKDLMQAGDLIECASQRCDFSTFEFLPARSSRYHLSRLEGYLYPDTYYIDAVNFVPKFFLERLLGTFDARVITGLQAEIASSGRSAHEIVTMASLIERETRSDDERAIVSGILWKRYDNNRGLDVDATIRYGLDKITAPLTKADLEDRGLYNTRRHVGLPPGPIASPGLKSIQAALNPEESPYWYYLHGNDGKIRYAETNDEHNANKAKYL